LARILQQKGINCKIFEKELSAEARSQGGSLDLHPESGQKALIEANLFDQAKPLLRYDAQDTKIMDKFGNVPLDMKEGDRDRPEIDRIALRKLLLDSVESGTVSWDRNLQKIVETNGSYELQFQNGISESNFDLIVGADGAWSKSRLICPYTYL
jgi:2-polyprenyl-6-methoxyphenol hydroxylase-like FAD-dependent oxidoreductase